MNIKRFFGKNSKDALSMVRKALGDNAVILSNRAVNGGNEIMAFKEEDINALIDGEMNESSDFAQNVEYSAQADEALATPQLAESAQFIQSEPKPDYLRPEMTKPNHAVNQASIPQASVAQTKTVRHELPAVQTVSPMNDALRALDSTNAQQAQQPISRQDNERPTPVVTQEAAVAPVNAAAPKQAVPQDKSQLAAMLKEMSSMRREIESQLTTFKQTELKPLDNLPRNVSKVAEAPVTEVAPEAAPVVQAATAPVIAEPVKQEPPQQSPQMLEMLAEMRNMRSAFESQLTSLNWANISQRDPIKSEVLSALLSAGFSASLSRQMAENIPDAIEGVATTTDSAKAWVKRILELNLSTIDHENELFDEGGVFALIGPTGVGKTTTTAKLAARYVMKHGTESIGIITTDAYRVGGHEQLRIYGKILGVMVHAVKDETDLKIALNELKNKHTILIDTVGVSQKDRMVAEQIAMLSNTQRPIKKLLCLNATNTGETLTDVVRAYKGKGLDGCILTKIDEAATIGNALDVVIRHKLKLYYATNGQRVPEDIEYSDKTALVEQAFVRDAQTQAPFDFLEEELPFVMGNMAQHTQKNEVGAAAHA
jgi:flagellar biosynthesis protein FlhF